MAPVNIDSFLQSFGDRIEAPMRQHLKNVYACLTMSTIVAATGAYIHLYTSLFSGGLLSTLAAVIFMLALFSSQDDGKNRHIRLGYLLGFSFCTGLGLGPLVGFAVDINPSIIVTAFVGTSLVFVAFSLSAMFAQRGSWLYLGGTLLAGLNLLVILTFANLFFGSYLMFEASLYLGLLVMCGFVLYDTQLIMEKKRSGDGDFIRHAVDLFIDFVGIFRRLVIILSQKENQKRNRRD